MEKQKALMYVRVSSKEQEFGYSLDAQEKLGYDYADRNNFVIVKFWKVSESAWKLDRKYFKELLDYSKKHNIKNIIFDVPDRMTRNLHDLVKIDDLVKQHDVVIHFSRTNKTYHKNSKSEDEFMLGIESLIARKYSNDISMKAKMGMQEKVEQGGFTGDAPIGYINNRLERTLEIDPKRAPFVKKIFELYSTGNWSTSMLADKMHQDGLTSKRTNGMYYKSRLHHLLLNPVYCGLVRYKGKLYKGTHEPLISEGLFSRVQAMLNRKVFTSKKENYPFNNLLVCDCGCRIIGALYKKGKYLYYHCTGKRGKHDDMPYFKEWQLVNMFREPIHKACITPQLFEKLKEGLKPKSEVDAEYRKNALSRLVDERKHLTDRLSRLYEDKLDKTITDDFWKEKKTEYENRIAEIDTQFDASPAKTTNNYAAVIKTLELSKRLKYMYESGNLRQQANLLKTIGLNFLYKSGKLDPVMKKPFSDIAKGLENPEWRE
jgi:site-specific DNA recombinase